MLEDVRILDLTTLLPGPFCTLTLAALGAEVVKVEAPGIGDPVRLMPPAVEGVGTTFSALNRGKKSLTLNLKRPSAVEAFLRLVPRFDVVVEQFRPGVVDRLGVGYEAVRAVHPAVVYCSISSYGQDGPYRDRPAHDLNSVAASGILSATGTRDGEPVIPSVQLADVGGAALPAAVSILAALHAARRSGQGRHLDVSMLDGAVSWTIMQSAELLSGGPPPTPGGTALNGGIPCYGVYRTADDRWYSLGALEDKFWRVFCEALDRRDLLPQAMAQGEEGAQAREAVGALFAQRTSAEWDRFFAEHDVPAEPVLDLAEMLDHPQVRARGLFRDHPLADGWSMPAVRPPVPDTGALDGRPAPRLGEHTDAILREELGLDPEAISRLRDEGAIG